MKKVHFMGIGGSGASAIASIAQSRGYEVSGCDRVLPHNEYTKDLDHSQLFEGHSADHINEIDILAISPAITSLDPDSEELKKAKELGKEVITWQEFMGKYLEEGKFVIAVCGTHGKSTTTAMIGHLLEEAGLDPTVELGAVFTKWGKNYRVSESSLRGVKTTKQSQSSMGLPRFARNDIFVTEADEFNNNFLVSHPDITVINNLDMDHPEFFKDFDDYKESFKKFLLQNKGTIVANLEDQNVAELMKWIRKHTDSECLDFSRHEITLNLQIPGDYNKLNAKAAFQVGLLLGVEPQVIIDALNSFPGVGRRQEIIGEKNGAKIYSDYAVHPVEIEKTTEAIKNANPGKQVWVVFQPHMFTRTKGLFNEFVEIFKRINVSGVSIVDIFASREQDPGDMNSKILVEAIERENVQYDQVENLLSELDATLTDKDVVIFYGAGDIDKIARSWVKS